MTPSGIPHLTIKKVNSKQILHYTLTNEEKLTVHCRRRMKQTHFIV